MMGLTEKWYDAKQVDAMGELHYADDVTRNINHKGWFTDEFQDGTFRGAVLVTNIRAPRSRITRHDDGFGGTYRNRPRLALIGYVESFNDGFYADNCEWIDAPCDDSDLEIDTGLAHQADDAAQMAAEEEREYQRVESIKYRIEEAEDEIKRDRLRIADVLADWHRVRGNDLPLFGTDPHAATLARTHCRDRWRALRESIEASREEIAELSEAV